MEDNKIDYSKYYIKNKHTYNNVFQNHEVEIISSKRDNNDAKSIDKKPKIKGHKKPKSKGKRIFYLLTILVVLITITIVIADSIHGGYMVSEMISTLKGDTKQKTYYALETRVFDDLDSAKLYASEMRRMEGAGYVIHDNGFRVLLEVYESENDAESIAKKLRLDGESARVYKIEIGKIDYGRLPSDTRNIVKESIKFNERVYRDLYAIGVSLACHDIDENTAKMKIKGIKNEVHNIKDEFDANVDGHQNNVNIIKIKAQFVSVEAMLDNLSKDVVKRPNLLSDIRYTSCLIVNSYAELTRELA